MKTKYKDQDEDERELRMKILGSAGKKNESEDATVEEGDENEDIEDTDSNQTNTSSKKKQQNISEEEKNRLKQEREESLQNLTTEQMSNVSFLDELTGKPLEDDVLVCAIPMCGPYSTVKDFKFKVKLIPGSSKTGRAVSTSLNVFKNTEGITPQEKDYITSLNDSECMLQMLGGVKVSTPGLANKANNKKGKGKKK